DSDADDGSKPPMSPHVPIISPAMPLVPFKDGSDLRKGQPGYASQHRKAQSNMAKLELESVNRLINKHPALISQLNAVDARETNWQQGMGRFEEEKARYTFITTALKNAVDAIKEQNEQIKQLPDYDPNYAGSLLNRSPTSVAIIYNKKDIFTSTKGEKVCLKLFSMTNEDKVRSMDMSIKQLKVITQDMNKNLYVSNEQLTTNTIVDSVHYCMNTRKRLKAGDEAWRATNKNQFNRFFLDRGNCKEHLRKCKEREKVTTGKGSKDSAVIPNLCDSCCSRKYEYDHTTCQRIPKELHNAVTNMEKNLRDLKDSFAPYTYDLACKAWKGWINKVDSAAGSGGGAGASCRWCPAVTPTEEEEEDDDSDEDNDDDNDDDNDEGETRRKRRKRGDRKGEDE
ncbi:hypothetical protein TrRE_jg80, partial [Triparma retinervis]